MAFVVDASVTMAWCFLDEATSYTWAVLDRLQDTGAVVPTIWPLDVASVLLVGERRQRLTAAETTRFVQTLQGLPITVDDGEMTGALGPILALGREHGLSAYDAAYLELAMRLGLPLATQDARLSAAAARTGVPLIE